MEVLEITPLKGLARVTEQCITDNLSKNQTNPPKNPDKPKYLPNSASHLCLSLVLPHDGHRLSVQSDRWSLRMSRLTNYPQDVFSISFPVPRGEILSSHARNLSLSRLRYCSWFILTASGKRQYKTSVMEVQDSGCGCCLGKVRE